MICHFCQHYGERMKVYNGKLYHFYCFEKIKRIAQRVGGVL